MLSQQRRVNYLLRKNGIPEKSEPPLPTSDMVESSEKEESVPNGTSTENTSSLGGIENEKIVERYEEQYDDVE